MNKLTQLLESEVNDPEEESFLLFSQPIPSRSLGFVDGKADELAISINDKDYSIHQSPSLLVSNRKQGTTGAVLWQVTPRFAEWMVSNGNMFFEKSILTSKSNVLELGCGISGLIALVMASKVNTYIATDQEYVLKMLKQNISQNQPPRKASGARKTQKASQASSTDNIILRALDWEKHSVSNLYKDLGIDSQDQLHLLLACDCIYNEALIDPFVSVCADICGLAPPETPTVCLIAQQLRSAEVFEAWLRAFHRKFRVLRVDDNNLPAELASGSGFVVHMGILRYNIPQS